jgi:hypothetical protein
MTAAGNNTDAPAGAGTRRPVTFDFALPVTPDLFRGPPLFALAADGVSKPAGAGTGPA